MQPSNIDSRVARRRQPRVACVSVRDPLLATAAEPSAAAQRAPLAVRSTGQETV